MARDEFGDNGIEPGDVDRPKTDPRGRHTGDGGAWWRPRRGGSWPWLFLLLVAVVVAVVVQQLRPGGSPSASPVAAGGTSTANASPSDSPPARRAFPTAKVVGGQPVVQDLGHSVLGQTSGWDLFARGATSVVRVAMADGRVTRTPVPALGSGAPVALLPVRVGVLVRPQDREPGYVVRDGRPTRRLTGILARSGPAVPGRDLDHVWLQRGNLDHGSIDQVDVSRLLTNGGQDGARLAEPAGLVDRPGFSGERFVPSRRLPGWWSS